MASEARIVINGQTLTDPEAMAVRLAVDALANILSEGTGPKGEPIAVTDPYMVAVSRVQRLLAGTVADTPKVN